MYRLEVAEKRIAGLESLHREEHERHEPPTAPPQTLALVLVPPGMPHWQLDIRPIIEFISNPKRTVALVLELRHATAAESRSEGA
jgi:hypothetical protein